MAAVSLQAWQWAVLAAAYVLFFALPAVWMARRARRDGESAFLWGLLVLLTSLLGVLEYYEHKSVLRRRAKRAARAAAREAREATEDAEGTSGTRRI